MIGLVRAMIARRRAQAVTVALLTVFAAAAATAAPVYVSAAERAVIASALAAAPVNERVVTVDSGAKFDSGRVDDVSWAPDENPDFDAVLALETNTNIPYAGRVAWPRLVYRVGACGHLRLVAGRCTAGKGEVVIGEQTAREAGLRVGDALPTAPALLTTAGWVKVGPPVPLAVVGIYRLADPDEAYWGANAYVVPFSVERGIPEAIFTESATLGSIPPAAVRRTVDAVVRPSAVAPGAIGRLRAGVAEYQGDSSASFTSPDVVTTGLPDLLDRVDTELRLINEVVPIAAVPLVVLCWFVIFLAVAYGTAARRHELGLLALRGVRTPVRWWLAAGESALPVVVAAPVGYLLGVFAVRLVAPHLLTGPVQVSAGLAPLPWAAAAVGGALLAGLLALRGELATPAVDLLRAVGGAGGAGGSWRGGAAEAVVVVLAGAATVQLYAGGGRLVGIAQLVPVLTVLAIGLLLARAVRPLARWAGRRAYRRGRIAALLAARHLGRRGSSARLIPLLVVAIALFGFGVTAADVSARGRDTAAATELGAARVLRLRAAPVAALVRASHAADPDGRYAMVAVPLGSLSDEPPKIAVDTTRLARVASWPSNAGIPVSEVAARLRPPAPGSVTVRGTAFAMDVTVDTGGLAGPSPGGEGDQAGPGVQVVAMLVGADGLPVRIRLGPLAAGRTSVTTPVDCVAGCRIAQFVVSVERAEPPVTVTVGNLRQRPATGGADQPVEGATGADRWRLRPSSDPRVAPRMDVGPAGIELVAHSRAGAVEVVVAANDAPYPLPVASTGQLPARGLSGLDAAVEQAVPVAKPAVLPRLGGNGVLVDLDYLARVGEPLGEVQGEIWLAAGAPADITKRLTGAGVQIVGERRLTRLRARYDAQGPAVAIRFNLLSVAFVVLLAVGGVLLVATVDRRRYAEELRALRVQGVRRATVAATAVRLYLWVVGTSLVGGAVATAVAWAAAGPKLPMLSGDAVPVPPPRWPEPPVMLATFAGIAVVLALAVGYVARSLYKAAVATTAGDGPIAGDGSTRRDA